MSNRSLTRAVLITACVAVLAGCARKMLPVPDDIPLAHYSEAVSPEKIVLPNGLSIHFLEDRELPVISGSFMFRGGALLDTRPGLTNAMAEQMRFGGAGDLSPEQFDRELDRLAASISAGAGAESVSVSFSCLAGDIDRVLQLVSDVMLRPRFDERRLELARAQTLESIRRRTDEPWTVAGIGFQQLLFGRTPYGWISTSEDVRAITRSRLLNLHRAVINPQIGYLGVSGAIGKDRFLELLEKHFGDWQIRGTSKSAAKMTPRPTALPAMRFVPKPGIYFVELPLSQASVIIGQHGVPRLTPDYPAIDVFNQIFGSGFFGSRLMKAVRTEKGLVYGISGAVGAGPTVGRTAIGFQTKSESVNDAIRASLEELLKLRSNLVSEAELMETKSAVSNAFVFKFDSMGEVVQRSLNLEFLHFPADFDSTYLPKIQAVTSEDVRQVALTRWNPEQLVILVVGNRSVWDTLPELREFPPLKGLAVKRLTFNEVLR